MVALPARAVAPDRQHLLAALACNEVVGLGGSAKEKSFGGIAPRTFSTDGCLCAAARCWKHSATNSPLASASHSLRKFRSECRRRPSRLRPSYCPTLALDGRYGQMFDMDFSTSGGLANGQFRVTVRRVARRWDGCAPRGREWPWRAPLARCGPNLTLLSGAQTESSHPSARRTSNPRAGRLRAPFRVPAPG